MLQAALNFVPVYVMVLFRIAGMMIYAPFLGSDRIPKRVKALIAIVLAFSIAPNLSSVDVPDEPWKLAVAIGGEVVFGLAMGMILSLIFVAAQWAGQLIGQQMGLNLGETLDPEYSGGGSMIGDLYFYLTLLIFLAINGHRAMLLGVRDSFTTLPLLSVGMDRPLLGTIAALFQSATLLAIRLATPILITMLIVDLVLGFVGKTMPQLNIMTAGVSVRALAGMVVLILGIGLASTVLRQALFSGMRDMYWGYAAH